MLSLILVAALNTAAPPAAPGQRAAGTGCAPAPLQLAADAAQPATPTPCPKPYLMAGPGARALPPRTERTPNLYRQPARCGPVAEEITRRIETSTAGRRMAATYAVVRTVDGCPVPTPASYHPDYLLPGAADPVRREDAPADRR
jgi:hypothetical protein